MMLSKLSLAGALSILLRFATCQQTDESDPRVLGPNYASRNETRSSDAEITHSQGILRSTMGRQMRIFGTNYSSQRGTKTLGTVVTHFGDKNFITYTALDFGSKGTTSAIRIRFAKGNNNGGTAEIRLGDKSGTVIAKFHPGYTRGWDKFTNVYVGIHYVEGIHDLTFIGVKGTGNGGVMNLEWFELTDDRKDVYPRVLGSAYADQSKLQSDDTTITHFNDGNYITYSSLNFGLTGTTSAIRIRFAKDNADGGNIEIRLGDKSGTVIAEFHPERTGGWSVFKEMHIDIDNVEDTHDLTFVGRGGGYGILNLEWFELTDVAFRKFGLHCPPVDSVTHYLPVNTRGHECSGYSICQNGQLLNSNERVAEISCEEGSSFDEESQSCGSKHQCFQPSYPLDQQAYETIRTTTKGISVLQEDRCELNLEDVLTSMNYRKDGSIRNVSPPVRQNDNVFWEQFKEVIKVRALVKEYKDNTNLDDPLFSIMPEVTLPEVWRGFSIHQVSEAVHDEFPGVYHSLMIAKWLGEKTLKLSNLIPKDGLANFLNGPVLLADMVGTSIRLVGNCNFAAKWKFGRARPEEIAWKIKKGVLKPRDTYKFNFTAEIAALNYDYITNFTDYKEGSPTHPSWPAMHSAASAASYWLSIVADLTTEQLCEARKLDYAISYARTVAGVHYPDDNIAGLLLGQKVLQHKLPSYLEVVYGVNKARAIDVAKDALYDWDLFNASACYKGSD